MRIGLCGAHRTGKTTLARLVSQEYGMPFVESPASRIVGDYGFDMGRDNRLAFGNTMAREYGLNMQQKIYDTVVENLDAQGSFVADRTPIDVAAYMLADATAGAGCQWTREATVQMVERAIRDTALLFDIVILVPPAIEFVAEEGKPPFNVAYQEHHHFLCRGILFDEDLDLYWDEIKRDTFSIEARMDFIRGTIAESGFAKAKAA